MLELDARACAFGDEAHVDLRREVHARLGLPLAIDLPTHDEARAGLPHAHVSDDGLLAVLVTRIPAPADERFDDGFDHGRFADVMRLRPPAIDLAGEER